MIFAVWLFNVFGIRPFKGLTYVTGGLLTIVLIVVMFVPYFTGDWHSSNVHATFTGPWGGWKLIFVWLFILGWSSWAAEVCATFAPEYKTRRDTTVALRTSAIYIVGVFCLVPLGLGGVTGVPPTATQEGQFYSSALQTIAGKTFGTFLLICLIASLILSMSSSTADGSRALYGISKAGLTIKGLGKLNRWHVPGNAMTVDLVVNVLLVLFISSNLAILYMSNIGYILCHFLAVSGFLLLRKDRPNWPRPIRVGRIWTPIAAFMAVFVAVRPDRRRWGPASERLWHLDRLRIGVGVLVGSVLLFIFRRVVQDGEHIHLREETPTMPTEADGFAPEETRAGVATPV